MPDLSEVMYLRDLVRELRLCIEAGSTGMGPRSSMPGACEVLTRTLADLDAAIVRAATPPPEPACPCPDCGAPVPGASFAGGTCACGVSWVGYDPARAPATIAPDGWAGFDPAEVPAGDATPGEGDVEPAPEPGPEPGEGDAA